MSNNQAVKLLPAEAYTAPAEDPEEQCRQIIEDTLAMVQPTDEVWAECEECYRKYREKQLQRHKRRLEAYWREFPIEAAMNLLFGEQIPPWWFKPDEDSEEEAQAESAEDSCAKWEALFRILSLVIVDPIGAMLERIIMSNNQTIKLLPAEAYSAPAEDSEDQRWGLIDNLLVKRPVDEERLQEIYERELQRHKRRQEAYRREHPISEGFRRFIKRIRKEEPDDSRADD